MGSADRAVVAKLIEEFGQSNYPGVHDDKVFERFAVVQCLKPVDLGFDEIEDGIVDGTTDGGVDAVFTTVNDMIVEPDSPFLEANSDAIAGLSRNFDLRLHIVQSKNQTSWAESVWEKLLSALPELISLESDFDEIRGRVKSEVVDRFDIFRSLLLNTASRFPLVTVRVFYASKGIAANRTKSLTAKATKVEEALQAVLPSKATVETVHVGVEELYERTGWAISKPATLRFRDLVEVDGAVLGVATIQSFLEFIRDESGVLRQDIFDANVRDYEGKNAVNGSILATLSQPEATPFWWLNNGVTVIGDELQKSGASVVVDRPLIVNGLQTSHVIDLAARQQKLVPERASDGIVVRILESDDEVARDKIIASTNNQTKVPSSALYASQPEQREIERFLAMHDWYYERRKNLYRNRGVDPARRVSVGLLAQAMIALLLKEPDTARARPSTGLKRNYEDLFASNLNLEAYLVALRTLSQTDAFLKSDKAKSISNDVSNVRFYMLAAYALRASNVGKVSKFDFTQAWRRIPKNFDSDIATEALLRIEAIANYSITDRPGATRDALFKNADFRISVLEASVLTDVEPPVLAREFSRSVISWIESKSADGSVNANVPAMTLLVLRRVVDQLPVDRLSYRTSRGHLSGLNGRFVNHVLREHGHSQTFTSEAGRTSRGTLALADEFTAWVNSWASKNVLVDSKSIRSVLVQAAEASVVEFIVDQKLAI